VWGEKGEGVEAGEKQIRAPGNPHSSFPRPFLRCVSGGGSIKNSAFSSAVHQPILSIMSKKEEKKLQICLTYFEFVKQIFKLF
jgi:hypothetical protein